MEKSNQSRSNKFVIKDTVATRLNHIPDGEMFSFTHAVLRAVRGAINAFTASGTGLPDSHVMSFGTGDYHQDQFCICVLDVRNLRVLNEEESAILKVRGSTSIVTRPCKGVAALGEDFVRAFAYAVAWHAGLNMEDGIYTEPSRLSDPLSSGHHQILVTLFSAQLENDEATDRMVRLMDLVHHSDWMGIVRAYLSANGVIR